MRTGARERHVDVLIAYLRKLRMIDRKRHLRGQHPFVRDGIARIQNDRISVLVGHELGWTAVSKSVAPPQAVPLRAAKGPWFHFRAGNGLTVGSSHVNRQLE